MDIMEPIYHSKQRKTELPYLIWLTCIEKPRPLGSLIAEWRYSSSKALYTTDIDPLIKIGMINKNTDGILYSQFKNYLIAIKEESDHPFVAALVKDKDKWETLWGHDFLRRSYFKLDNIKILFKEDRDVAIHNALSVPLTVFSLLLPYFYLKKEGKRFDEETLRKFQTIHLSIIGLISNPMHDTEAYLKSIYTSLSFSELNDFLDKAMVEIGDTDGFNFMLTPLKPVFEKIFIGKE